MAGAGRIEKRVLADPAGVEEALDRMAAQLAPILAERPVAMIGVQTGGVHVARRLIARLAAAGLPALPFGLLDITLYRDDIAIGLQQPRVRHTDIPFELTGLGVVLVDDVLYTGRTVRAALDALVDFGRPRFIRLACLVDRGLREYPIQADCVGLTAPTTADENVQVELTEMGVLRDRIVVYGNV